MEYKHVDELCELWNLFILPWPNDLGTQTWLRYCKDVCTENEVVQKL